MATTLASKPHSFSGAVLTPEHAKSLTTGHVLSLASALSLQAGNAAQVSSFSLREKRQGRVLCVLVCG